MGLDIACAELLSPIIREHGAIDAAAFGTRNSSPR